MVVGDGSAPHANGAQIEAGDVLDSSVRLQALDRRSNIDLQPSARDAY